MRADLTKTLLDDLKCPPGKKDLLVFDLKLSGFAVRVTKTGSKIFLVQYSRGKQNRRIPIGKFGVITAVEARRKAPMAPTALLWQAEGKKEKCF